MTKPTGHQGRRELATITRPIGTTERELATEGVGATNLFFRVKARSLYASLSGDYSFLEEAMF